MKEIEFLFVRDRIGRVPLEYVIAVGSVATFLFAVGLAALH
jgi:hypothetical protein